jgi:hypothetical protein
MKEHDSGAHVASLMKIDKSGLPADGGQGFNRLIFARSPYLLQHAENPVDWYEWGPQAFEKARSENRPILLSIGYATCHWCHVMAHESFGDEEVADLLNRHFVCIKVDREERPDIDDFYMTVSQLLTGGGGWPLNIFMTPDKHPFFSLTYLPKRGQGGRSGLMDLLAHIATLWSRHPEDIAKNCSAIMDAMAHLSHQPDPEYVEPTGLADPAFSELSELYDSEKGGFGRAPKFPMPIYLSWLLEQGVAGNGNALEMARHSLTRMRRGGIWDQLGGGLHRYAVDRNWLVPHFEKMLYDQAMLAMVSLEAFQACGDPFFLAMAENIFGFVDREMTSPEGVFYSALDADSEGVEGKFYLWDKKEIEKILADGSELFCRFFDVSPSGNFEGQTILNIPVDSETFSAREGREKAELELLLEECCERLLEYRADRIRPLRDEKVITSWNGLMIAALARGAAASGNGTYAAGAARAARFILKNLRRADKRLMRSFLNGPAEIPAFLEDYSFLCHGLIELFEATLDPYWQEQALELADQILSLFRDPDSGVFSKTGQDAEQMPVQATQEHDGVIPSAFSLAAKCFIRLGHACDRSDLLDHAHILLAAPLQNAQKHPTANLGALQAAVMLENEPVMLTYSGELTEREIAGLVKAVRCHAGRGWVVFRRESDSSGPGGVLACADGTCFPAVQNPADLGALLERILPVSKAQDADNPRDSRDSRGESP